MPISFTNNSHLHSIAKIILASLLVQAISKAINKVTIQTRIKGYNNKVIPRTSMAQTGGMTTGIGVGKIHLRLRKVLYRTRLK